MSRRPLRSLLCQPPTAHDIRQEPHEHQANDADDSGPQRGHPRRTEVVPASSAMVASNCKQRPLLGLGPGVSMVRNRIIADVSAPLSRWYSTESARIRRRRRPASSRPLQTSSGGSPSLGWPSQFADALRPSTACSGAARGAPVGATIGGSERRSARSPRQSNASAWCDPRRRPRQSSRLASRTATMPCQAHGPSCYRSHRQCS